MGHRLKRLLVFRATAFIVGLLLLAGPASAQTEQTPSTTPDASAPVPTFRTDIVVTAERGETPQVWIPAATVAVDAATLRSYPALTLGEVLSFVPGFRVQQPALSAGRPVVSARGFFGGGEAEYVALLVDGVRVADAESGLVDWSAVSGSAVSRIDAARGPGASLYGDAAIGGVIQVLTDSAATSDVFTASGGSLGTFSIDGTSRWKRRSVSGFLSGAARRTDGISDHSDASEFTFGSALEGRVSALSWRWTANIVDRSQQDPGVLSLAQRDQQVESDPLFRFDDRNRRTLLTAVTLRSGGSKWMQRSRVSVDRRHEDGIRTILLAPALGDTRYRDLTTDGVGGTFELERTLPGSPNSAVRIGVDVERQHLDTSYRNVGGGEPVGDDIATAVGSRLRSGAFASTSWMPDARVRLFGALRWDRIADSDFGRGSGAAAMRAWSPRAGIVVQPAWLKGASLFGQISRAFKAPTVDQMFDPRPFPDFRGSTFMISNALLRAQRASNFEAGAFGGGAVRWSVLAYRMNVANEIDFDPRTFRYGNIGRSRHTGLEVEAQGPTFAYIRPVANYAWSDVSAASGAAGGSAGPYLGQLKNIPRHQVMVGAHAALGWNLEAFASVRRTWDVFLDDENLMPIRSRPLVDLRVRRAIGKVVVFADVLNAIDQRYDEFGFVLTDFRGARIGYVYPGQPRVLRMGLTLNVK
jgi:outer membrane receptor protein involved in Fe transport